MSLLQRQDVATTEYLDSIGVPHSELLNDTKIWVTANGINRTLKEAIVDKVMGIKGTAGARIRKIGSFHTDSSSTPIGGVSNPTVLSGKMFIDTTDWVVRASTYFIVVVDGEIWIERDEENTNTWSRNTVTKQIILNKDLSSLNKQVVIVQFIGVAPPTSSIQLNTGLRPVNEAVIIEEQTIGTNCVVTSKTPSKITIQLSFELNSENTFILYSNGKYVPRKHLGLSGINFDVISSKIIEVENYVTLSELMFIELPVKSTLEGTGSTIVQTERIVKSYTVKSTDLSTWAIGVDDDGNIYTNDSYDDISEPILIRNDANIIVGIGCDNEGRPFADSDLSVGVVFENIILKSNSSKYFRLGVTVDNQVYVTEVLNQKGFFVKNFNGQEIFGLSYDSFGSALHLPKINSLNDIPDFEIEAGFTYLASILINGENRIACWDSVENKWRVGQNVETPANGEIIQSIQSAEKLQELFGGEWVRMDGSTIPTTHQHYNFLSQHFYENGVVRVPDMTCYEYAFISTQVLSDTKIKHPKGFKQEHIVMSSHSIGVSGYGANNDLIFDNALVFDNDYIYTKHGWGSGYQFNVFVGYRKSLGIHKYLKVS